MAVVMGCDYRVLFESVRRYRTQYLVRGTYEEVVAFVTGCDAGNSWCLLAGFREWLLVRFGGPRNLSWAMLVLQVAFPDRVELWDPDRIDGELGVRAINVLFDCLEQFLAERAAPGALADLYSRYSAWLSTQADD